MRRNFGTSITPEHVELAPHAELIVVPRTTHLVTAMRPGVFNAVLGLALAVVQERS